MPDIKTVKLSEIIFDKNIYPRKEHDPTLVQRYAETMESIEQHNNYISVDSKNRLVDGRHRHLAYKTLYLDDDDHEVSVYVYPNGSDAEAFALAVELNSDFGWQMTPEDKRSAAIKMYQSFEMTQDEVAKRLKIGIDKVNQWLKSILESEKKEREQQAWELWLQCYPNIKIAEIIDRSSAQITAILQKFSVDFCGKDSEIFRNFDPQIYTTWNFAKSTNKIKHFGNIPPEILDNLLYYYTQPFDIIFDPFAGGGMTIDVCKERKRRYYVSDLTPIPARAEEIRQWDIKDGLPEDLPVPDLVFLDPPYWKQAEKKYSDKDTDLGNVDLDTFKDVVGMIARDIKRKWANNRPNAKLVIITSPFYRAGEYVDLPLICHDAIGKYLTLAERISVPYSSEVVGGDDVKKAKADKRMIHLVRDLMVFKK